jgi:hypothetical protein
MFFFDNHELVINQICIKWFVSGIYAILKSWDDCVDYMKRFDMRGFEVGIDYGSYQKLPKTEMNHLGLENTSRNYPKYPYCYTLVFKIEYEELENATKTVFVTTAKEVRTKVRLEIN